MNAIKCGERAGVAALSSWASPTPGCQGARLEAPCCAALSLTPAGPRRAPKIPSDTARHPALSGLKSSPAPASAGRLPAFLPLPLTPGKADPASPRPPAQGEPTQPPRATLWPGGLDFFFSSFAENSWGFSVNQWELKQKCKPVIPQLHSGELQNH